MNALVPPRCLGCASVLDGDARLCAICAEQLEDAPAPALWALAGPLKDIVYRAKYSHDVGAAVGLAGLFADGLARRPRVHADVVTYVPASARRAAVRGFDLPALMADAAAPVLGAACQALLRATRHDASLAASAERAARAGLVAGRFGVRRPVAGLTVVVIDDVTTTGATLTEACRVLTEAGATAVPLTLARTPDAGDTALAL